MRSSSVRTVRSIRRSPMLTMRSAQQTPASTGGGEPDLLLGVALERLRAAGASRRPPSAPRSPVRRAGCPAASRPAPRTRSTMPGNSTSRRLRTSRSTNTATIGSVAALERARQRLALVRERDARRQQHRAHRRAGAQHRRHAAHVLERAGGLAALLGGDEQRPRVAGGDGRVLHHWSALTSSTNSDASLRCAGSSSFCRRIFAAAPSDSVMICSLSCSLAFSRSRSDFVLGARQPLRAPGPAPAR